jgi:hypothetical protein
MAWVLRLVETGIDGPARVIDVTDIRPLGALGDISKLGLMLSEAKQILARLQQAVVAIQADDHAVLRPVCAHFGRSAEVGRVSKTDIRSLGILNHDRQADPPSSPRFQERRGTAKLNSRGLQPCSRRP